MHHRSSTSENASTDFGSDQRFKEIVHDRDILASLLKGVVPEFKGMPREEIFQYLDIGNDGHTVRGKKTELVSSENGPVYMDSVFDVKIPGKGDISIIVAIEGQGPQMSDSLLHNRQTYYSCRLISEQAKDFQTKKELYEGLRKTTVIWVKLSPHAKDRNTIVRDFRCRVDIREPERVNPSPLDKTEIIEINVGPHTDTVNELLGLLDVIFNNFLEDTEKHQIVKQKYDIDLRQSILREARNMGALAEEFEICREEALEEGMEKGMEKEMSLNIDYYAPRIADKVRELSITPEEAIELVDIVPKYRDAVLERVKEILSEG